MDGGGGAHGGVGQEECLVGGGQFEEQSGVASGEGHGRNLLSKSMLWKGGDQAVQHHDEGVHLCGDGRVARDDAGGEGGGADAQRPGVSHNQSGDKET